MPQALVEDPVLLGEGMSGAMYWKDFIALAKKVGFTDPRLMKVSFSERPASENWGWLGVLHTFCNSKL